MVSIRLFVPFLSSSLLCSLLVLQMALLYSSFHFSTQIARFSYILSFLFFTPRGVEFAASSLLPSYPLFSSPFFLTLALAFLHMELFIRGSLFLDGHDNDDDMLQAGRLLKNGLREREKG